MKLLLGNICSALALLCFFSFAKADPDWTNQGPDNSFENPDNWINVEGVGAVPGPGDSAHVFPGFTVTDGLIVNPGGASTITIDASASHTVASFLVSGNFESNSITNGVVNLNFTSGTALTLSGESEDSFVVTGASTMNFTGNMVVTDGSFVVGTSSSTIDGGEVTGSGTVNFGAGTVNLDSADETSLIVGENASSGSSAINQNNNSVVIAGENMIVGSAGTGTYTLNGNSILDIGSTIDPQAEFYNVTIGTGSSAVGTMNIGGTSTLNVLNANTFFEVGVGSGATGVINQTSAGSTVNFGSTGTVSEVDIGTQGGTGTYNLTAGTVNIVSEDVYIGDGSGSNGTFSQKGGTATADANSDVVIGYEGGTGSYKLQGGTASFGDVLEVGAAGTVSVSGGTLSLGNAPGSVLQIDGGGTVTQTGGTVVIGTGQTIDLTTAGGSYNLNGGKLQVGNGAIDGGPGEGSLNFGGGTLQITSTGAFTDSADGTLSVNSTINASNGGVTTATFSGNLSGTGGITLDGSAGTTFYLTGNNTYTGATEIAEGTLVIDPNSSNAITSSSLKADGGTVIDLNLNAGGLAYGGSLNGSGTINVDFANAGDALVVKSESSFNGALALGANGTPGVLQVFSGSVGNVSGTGSGVVIGGTPLVAFPGGGSGPNSGTVTFTGAATYTGPTTINPGFTLLAPSLTSPTVTNTGTLGSNAAVGTVFDVGAGGLGTLNMPEGANQGTLLIRLADANSDRFDAATANLFGTVKVSGFTTIGTSSYDIVDAGTLTTGTLNTTGTGGLDATANSALLSVSLSQVGDQLILTVDQKPISGFANTPNQKAVAEALDVGLATPASSGPIYTALNTLSAAQIPGALDQLTPRPYLYMRDITFENTTFLAQRMDGVMANIRTGFSGLDTNGLSVLNPGMESSLGQSLGSLLAYNNERPAPNGVNYYPVSGDSSDIMQMPGPSEATPTQPGTISDSADPRMAPTVGPPPSTSVFDGNGSGFNEFISGDVILGDLNQNQNNNNEPKAHYTAGNATAGVSFRMTSNIVAGVLFDYNHTDAKTDTQDSHVKVDSYSPGLFATYFDKGFYANGLFTFGYNNYSDDRNLSFGGTGASGTSSPSGQQYALNLGGGYDFHPNPHWVIGPTASLGYTHLDIDSFSEAGAGPFGLTVASQSADSLRARIGGHVLYQVHAGSILFQPNLSLSYQHEFLNDDFNLDSQLAASGTPGFATQGTNPGRDTGLISLGLTATLDNSMALYLDYLAEYGGSDYFIQSVEGGLKASF